MKEPDWDRIQEIYHEALKLPSSDRRAFIARAANDDPALIREVNELVGVGVSLGDFLETPIVELPLTHAPENLIETTIDNRYVIEKELGRGGMGQLYLARDAKVDGRLVVLKFLLRELTEDPDARQRFRQESEALSRIRHANVVEVLDTGQLADARPYFVMEYVDGETLDRQIPREGMPLRHAASILRQIGAALEHVHAKGVFHRDLKPENIMLRRGTDSVVLIDFGIARVANPLESENDADVPAGTLMYMSPEQLQCKEITAASDIYSMAVTAYEMITGRRPFNATSREQLLAQQRKGVDVKPVVLRRDLPPKAQDLILGGLSFKPENRYKNAKQFGNDLAHALAASSQGSNIKAWLKVAAILLVTALVSFGVYTYFVRKSDSRPPNRSVSYFVTLQRAGNENSTLYKSHGEEMFYSGDNFRLTVFTPVDASVYVFHDGTPKENGASFKLIFPRKTINDGSASLGAGKSIDSEWMRFEGPPGVENFWIVWSTSPVRELEAVKKEMFDNGGLSGDTLVSVKQYLTTKKAEINATTHNYNANQTAVVRARHDLLVALAQFKHR